MKARQSSLSDSTKKVTFTRRSKKRSQKKPSSKRITISSGNWQNDPLRQALLAKVHMEEGEGRFVLPHCLPPEFHERSRAFSYKCELEGQHYKVHTTFDVVPHYSHNPCKGGMTCEMVDVYPFAFGAQGDVHRNQGKYKIRDTGEGILATAKPKSDTEKRYITKKVHVEGGREQIKSKYQERDEVLARVKHLHAKPSTFDVYVTSDQADEIEGHVYSVSKEFAGMNLLELINKLNNGELKLTASQLLQLTKNIIQAFQGQVVDCDVVHRDIKPENIIVNPLTLEVNFIDYDLARKVEDSDRMQPIVGTPEFIAPEVIRGKGSSVESDLYSLGMTLYQLLSGKERNVPGVPSNNAEMGAYLNEIAGVPLDFSQLGKASYLKGEAGRECVRIMTPILRAMTHINPAKRSSANQLLRDMENHHQNDAVFNTIKKTALSAFSLIPTCSEIVLNQLGVMAGALDQSINTAAAFASFWQEKKNPCVPERKQAPSMPRSSI